MPTKEWIPPSERLIDNVSWLLGDYATIRVRRKRTDTAAVSVLIRRHDECEFPSATIITSSSDEPWARAGVVIVLDNNWTLSRWYDTLDEALTGASPSGGPYIARYH